MNRGMRRRSARLLSLQEKENEEELCIADIDTEKINSDNHECPQKRGRKKKIQETDEEATYLQQVDPGNNGTLSGNPSAPPYSTKQIIDYILDILQVKDTKELFSMPKDIQFNALQENDYSERVNNPGDFAMLRQKNKDGMYKRLEQIEGDIYMVFHKAITSNTPNSLPSREALYLQEHAKQLFQSLKSNRACTEKQLSSWHQKYFLNNRRTESSNARNQILNNNRSISEAPQARAMDNPRPCDEKGKEKVVYSKSCKTEEGYTEGTGNTRSEPIVMQPAQLVYMHCVQDTSPQSQNAIAQHSMEDDRGAENLSYNSWFDHFTIGKSSSNNSEDPNCKLETDDLLRSFSMMQTIKSSEKDEGSSVDLSGKGKSIITSSSQAVEPERNFGSFLHLRLEGSGTIDKVETSYTDIKLHAQEEQCLQRKQKILSLYDLIPSSPQQSDAQQLGQTGSADFQSNESSTTNGIPFTDLSFQNPTSPSNPSKPTTLNLFDSNK